MHQAHQFQGIFGEVSVEESDALDAAQAASEDYGPQGTMEIAQERRPVPAPDYGYPEGLPMSTPIEPPASTDLYQMNPYPFADQSKPLGELSATTTMVVVPLVLAAGGAAAGGLYAGGWGAGAGLLLTGAAVNAYRFAASKDQASRTTHGVFAIIAGGAGAYLAYKAAKGKKVL
jgi:hypothetical protein